MPVNYLKSFNARRAVEFGYKLSFTDRLILMRSWIHTHTEWQFGPKYDKVSFSFTLKDEAKGARFKDIGYSHPERWDHVCVPLSQEKEDMLYCRFSKMLGMKYDLIGLLGFTTKLPLIRPNKSKRWCTSGVIGPAIEIGIFEKIPLDFEKMHPSWGDMMARNEYSLIINP